MKYTILEEESGMHQVNNSFARAMARHKELFGNSVRNWVFYRKWDRFKWAFELEEFTEQGKAVLEKIVNEKTFADQISLNVRKYSEELSNFSDGLAHTELKDKSDKELASSIREYSRIMEDLFYWGLMVETMEVYNNVFSEFVKKEIIELIEKKGLSRTADEYLAILTIPMERSNARKQEIEFLGLVSETQKNQESLSLFENSEIAEIIAKLNGTPLGKSIVSHLDKYCWVNYYYEGPEMDLNYIVDLLAHATRTIYPEQKLKEIMDKEKSNAKLQETMMKELEPGKFAERLLLTAREFATIKMIRKESMFFGSYAMDKLRKEMCKRFEITLDQCRCMSDKEMIAALEHNSIDRNELKEREKEMAQLIDNGVETIFSGDKAREISKNIIEVEIKDVTEIIGTCASPGKVVGIVRIISHIEDMSKMNEGDVLVANATNPNFVPAMKKAGAIVTDMGGITCHAAIVSREFGVPCVVGTKVATKMLKDGDEVEVDAVAGTVKILKKASDI